MKTENENTGATVETPVINRIEKPTKAKPVTTLEGVQLNANNTAFVATALKELEAAKTRLGRMKFANSATANMGAKSMTLTLKKTLDKDSTPEQKRDMALISAWFKLAKLLHAADKLPNGQTLVEPHKLTTFTLDA